MSRWWLLAENYQDKFREKWIDEHPNEQTPQYRLRKLHAKQFRQGESTFNEIKIPTTFYDKLSEEDLELERKLKKEADDYQLQEELYIAEQVYKNIGWEEFQEDIAGCRFKEEVKRLLSHFIPCKSADAQCSFDCPRYEICQGNVET